MPSSHVGTPPPSSFFESNTPKLHLGGFSGCTTASTGLEKCPVEQATYGSLLTGRRSDGGDCRILDGFLLPNLLQSDLATLSWAFKQLPILLSIHHQLYRRGSTSGSIVVDYDTLVQSLMRLLSTMHFADLCLGPGRGATVSVYDYYEYRNWVKGELEIGNTSVCCSSHWLAMKVLAHNLNRALLEGKCVADVEDELQCRVDKGN
ncbi:hypothetical protein FOZ62_005720 [Perkinsus olseni]|uniref:Uncharacterized protein n=1 Tax=Perkinsus olseni TaxID=32597 RepID=A0A7J6QZM7_PEROL|nr:hypothetical protein FOZ62_005720 [Perkinsus olseni]